MTEAKTEAVYRGINHLDGEVTCSGCKALIARIAELEAEKRRLIGHLAVAQAQAETATALGSGNR
jgi:hypothetical protein